MKKIFYSALLVLIVFTSCKKDYIIHIPDMQKGWQKQLNDSDYAALDLDGKVVSHQNGKWYYKFCIKGKDPKHNFLIVQLDSTGTYLNGRFIELERTSADTSLYSGYISMQSLKRALIVSSSIDNGYIVAWHQNKSATMREESFPVPIPYDGLPEVIVVAYSSSSSDDGSSYTDYMNLQSLLNAGGSGGTGTVPGSAGNNYQNSGTAVYTSTGGAASNNSAASGSTNLTINFDDSYYRPAIDLDAWIKCFTNIPDAGSTCSVTLCADLPVDDDPSVTVNMFTGATGHCFLQLKKTNGDQSITQVIGFTAQNALTAINKIDQFVPSKLVDNAGHKYDASLTMNVNVSAFNTMLSQMRNLSQLPYSITHFDCLDFDLSVINSVRPNNPIHLPVHPVADNVFSIISTGERMYSLLEQMKETGDPEAPAILTGGPLYIGTSHGPCN